MCRQTYCVMTFLQESSDFTLRSGEGFEALFQNATIGIVTVDRQGVIELANPFLEKMFGYSNGTLKGKSIDDLVPENLRSRHQEDRKEYMKAPKARPMGQNMDLKARRLDGSLFPVEISLAHYRSGSRDMVVAFVIDISTRKKAEELVSTNERRFRLLIENTPAPVAMFNTRMEYIMVSKRWLVDYKLGDRDVTGLCHYDLFPNLPDHWREFHKRAFAGETIRCEEDSFVTQGEEIWVRWEISPWHTETGEVGGLIIFSEVITDRKKAEIALRRIEERYRLFFEAINEVLIIHEAVRDNSGQIIDLRYLDLNHEAEKELGKTRSELIGHMRSEALGDFDPQLRNIVDKVLVKKELVKMERYNPASNKWYEMISYSSLPDQMITLSLDITLRKERGIQLKKANDELLKRTRKLEKLTEELRDLAYVAAHHLQEPLRKLQTFTSLLQRSETCGADVKEKQYLNKVLAEASLARERVADLLLLTNLNIRTKAQAPVDLNSLLKEILDEKSPEIEATHAKVELLNPFPTIYADAYMMKSLFFHLISNSIKFRKSDIPPDIKIHSVIVPADSLGNPAVVNISIEDNGIGIKKENVAQLFKIFKKLNLDSMGTGVGLAISRKICNLHGGDLTIESKENEGSTFTVTLPLKEYK